MEYKLMDEYIGKCIQSARQERGLSLSKLGKMTGMTRQRLCNYEQGIRTMPLDKFFLVCRALGIDGEQLFTEAQVYTRMKLFRKE